MIDGVEYTLVVRAADPESSRFFSGYFCNACHKGEVKYNLRPTADDATKDGNQLAMLHHEREHGQSAEFPKIRDSE